MSDFEYFDDDGSPITLYRLVRKNPEWAASRITLGREQAAEIERLKNPRKLTTEELCHLRFSCLPDDLTDAQDMQIMINNLYPKLIQLYAEAES